MAKEQGPREQLAELASRLTGAPASSGPGEVRALGPGFVLRGPERFFRERALELVRAAAERSGAEVVPHDADDPSFSLQGLCDDLRDGGLFASQRCIVLRNGEALLALVEGEDPPAARAIRTFLSARRGPLVLEGESLRADNRSVKALAAAGGLLCSFRKLYDAPAPWARDPDPLQVELVEWVLERASARRLALEPAQALLLARARGNDLAALDGELAAAAAAGGRPRFEGLASEAAGAPFRLAEALAQGERGRALAEIEKLFRSGFQKDGGGRETDQKALWAMLLGGLRRVVRQALAVSAAMERGASFDAAADQAGVAATAFARGPVRKVAGVRTPAQVRAMHRDLLLLERRSKDGSRADANDLARLTLRWALPAARAAR